MTHQEQLEAIKSLLNQFIVFGQKQQPFNCARCGAGSDDKEKDFCWCTDRDSSSTASSPTWIDNVNYPRFVEAEGKAISAITALIQEAVDEGRVGALLDLEEWAKLHDLDSEQILGGIEHMVKSIIQVPNQRHKSHTKRIKELSGGSNNE